MIGISKASDLNVCSDTNSTLSCVPSSLLILPEGEETEVEDDPNEFAYWLAGATGCGLLFALICMLGLWALEDAFRRIRKCVGREGGGEGKRNLIFHFSLSGRSLLSRRRLKWKKKVTLSMLEDHPPHHLQ